MTARPLKDVFTCAWRCHAERKYFGGKTVLRSNWVEAEITVPAIALISITYCSPSHLFKSLARDIPRALAVWDQPMGLIPRLRKVECHICSRLGHHPSVVTWHKGMSRTLYFCSTGCFERAAELEQQFITSMGNRVYEVRVNPSDVESKRFYQLIRQFQEEEWAGKLAVRLLPK